MEDKKGSSHIGAGMLIGAAIGVAAATFLQSKQGKVLTKDLMKKTNALQKKINAELKKAGNITKENYEQLVDKVIAYYVKSKDIAQKEIPEVRKTLLSTWKTIEREIKSLKSDEK